MTGITTGGAMSGMCAAGVWMAVTTEFGVPLRDVDPWALVVLLLVLVFLRNILASDCPEGDTLMLLSVRAK